MVSERLMFRAEKRCSGCSETKLLVDFYERHDGRQAGKLSSRCKACASLESRARQARIPGDQMVRAAKFRAKEKGMAFDLDPYKADISDRVLDGCELTGLPFMLGSTREWNSPSIDRIKPELGYVYTNIRIILWGLNCAFGYWGEEKAEVFMRAWLAGKD